MNNYYNPNDFDINYKEYVARFNYNLIEDLGFEKNIKSEKQKFKHNAAIAFTELGDIILKKRQGYFRYRNAFQDITEYEEIDVSYNPKALVFAFVSSMIFLEDKIVYNQKIAQKAIANMNRIYDIEESFFRKLEDPTDVELLRFFKTSGIDANNIIRYFRFLELKYN
jgi:hypothetical protein